jgi:hypothetical protein
MVILVRELQPEVLLPSLICTPVGGATAAPQVTLQKPGKLPPTVPETEVSRIIVKHHKRRENTVKHYCPFHAGKASGMRVIPEDRQETSTNDDATNEIRVGLHMTCAIHFTTSRAV